ncbi:helix-turn-helix domain-containing protein [Sphingobacterium bambusae]|uniref:Transcription regulator BetR N-terminal domain-containing protein n=1 Tax=Sphingobacterium bambusae TaxID=662858 RepID=A0ABW6BBB9_9SPHI|nr:hypothetical protein [Sphingobacterium bambusae]WPL48233.1 hypothetical protein SCB77_19995 [Sphingobacterium bambusae]
MFQEKLIATLYKKKAPSTSLITELANVLDISYDAAHRRISMKSKFSVDEAVVIAKHYGISLDNLFAGQEQVLVKKTEEIKNFQGLSVYFESAYRSLREHPAEESTQIYYSAKDIPLFYTIQSGLLSKFKSFVWLNLLANEEDAPAFSSFQIQAPLVESSQNLYGFYENVSKHEIWNDTTINSTLQQIVYFFQAGLLTGENAVELCEQIKELLFSLEQQCMPNNEQYKLYYHELLILNNNVLVSDQQQRSLFVPYTMLGYFITKDERTCRNALDFFHHQFKNSKLLNTAGTRDRKIFFNRAYQKIEFYKQQVLSTQDFNYL